MLGMSCGECSSQIVSLMAASSCAPRATRKTALRGLMFVPAIFALYGWSAAAQSTTTYTYTGNPFSVPLCQSAYESYPNVSCVSGSIAATVTFQNLPPNYTGSWTVCNAYPSCASVSVPYIPIISFSIGGGGTTLTSGSPNVCFPYPYGDEPEFTYFEFGNGLVSRWQMYALIFQPNPYGPCYSTGSASIEVFTFGPTDQGASDGAYNSNGGTWFPIPGATAGLNRNNSGSWTLTGTQSTPSFQITTASLPNATAKLATLPMPLRLRLLRASLS
jgi:hypothetical protein